MKILNLYAGIGGNRKLWGNDHDITAVEYIPEIANLYSEYFPNDKMIVGDAHQYLLEHFQEFDFIWASPPCPSHSDIRRCGVQRGLYNAIYPDMALYQEIILLSHFYKGLYCVENVKPYYKSLIAPSVELGRHYFWANFHIDLAKPKDDRIHSKIGGSSNIYGFDLKDKNITDKRKILRNLVNPEIGKYILDCALSNKDYQQETIFNELT